MKNVKKQKEMDVMEKAKSKEVLDKIEVELPPPPEAPGKTETKKEEKEAVELVQLEEARSREELELIRVEKGKKQKKTDVINEHKTDVMENVKK